MRADAELHRATLPLRCLATAHWCGSSAAQGLIFCVATDSGVLKLYDIRSYEKGPFDTFTVRVVAAK